jgi:ABC-2 type transport system ATP-binding protein
MKPPIMQATNLTKVIKNKELFQENWQKTLWSIDHLALDSLGFYLLAGKNGSGKSTLLRSLLGLVKPTSGEILWHGRSHLNSQDIGYIPEFPIISPAAKVKDWLSWITNQPLSSLMRIENDFAKFPSLSILEFLNVPANRLSKGQQQRVQLWAALSNNPSGLVLDEPFSGLDPWAKQELSDLLLAVLAEGKFVLMSSHEITQKLRNACTTSWMIENETVKISQGCVLPS